MGGGSNEDALSEIVGFVLILALVVVASTLYLMYVVPAEGREDEIEHMNKVQDRFVSYKTSVDGLWLRSIDSSTGTRGVSLSTSFDLGTGGGNTQSSGIFLSFMRPIGTAARMQTRLDTSDPAILSDETDRIGLAVDNLPRLVTENEIDGADPWHDVPIGSLSYHTDNYYWIQQNYHYKLGGIFLEQPGEGVSVKVAPSIAIYRVIHGTGENAREAAKISISLVNITSDDSTVGGTGPLRVETRLRESMAETCRNEPVDNVTLHITNNDRNWLEAWRQVFIDAAMQSDLDRVHLTASDLANGNHEWITIPELEVNPDSVQLQIRHRDASPGTKDIVLDLTQAALQVTFEYDE